MKALRVTAAAILTCGLLIGMATVNPTTAHACMAKGAGGYVYYYCAP